MMPSLPAALVPRPRGRTMRRTLRQAVSRFSTAFRFSRQEGGQDLVEYGLLVAFIALAAMAAMHNIESGVISNFTTVAASSTAPF